MTKVHVVTGLLFDDHGRVLIGKRPKDRVFPDCWEFPGGKVDAGETPHQALVREWREELRLDVEAGSLIFSQEFPEPDGSPRQFLLSAFHIFQVSAGVPVPDPKVHAEVLWMFPSAVLRLQGTPSLHPIIQEWTNNWTPPW